LDYPQESLTPKSESRPAGLPDGRKILGVCLFLVAMTWVVFGQTAHFEFFNYDDDVYVYENGKVASGLTLQGVTWLFTHAECHFYHPLTMISLMLDYQLHGLHPGGYHLTNVLIHTASAILLFLILRRMTGALWRSAFVAAVFAIHPLRAESVAWVSERKDVLATFFFMLTLGAYVRYARDPKSLGRYLMVAGLFVLGLLCKPTAVALPFALLLLDYWPLNRFTPPTPTRATAPPIPQAGYFGIPKRLILEKIPLVVLAAVACVVTYFAEGEAVTSVARVPIPMRLGNVLVSYVVYLRQMVWPAGLAAFYPYPVKGFPLWETGLAFLLLAGISGGVLAFWRKRPWLLAGWFWYLGMMAPVIGIVQLGGFAHADRNTYLPQIGLYVLLTWAAADLSANWRHRSLVQGACATAILVALIFCAHTQTAYWRDSQLLWTHTLSCTSGNTVAHNDLGIFLALKGEREAAIAQYRKALAINPGYAAAYCNLGNSLALKKEDLEEAIAEYRKALEITPDSVEARNNLGLALMKNGQVDEAVAQYRKALETKPDSAEIQNNLGNALAAKGNLQGAIAQYRKALEINPDYVEAHYNLGNSLALNKGDIEEAIAQYHKALQIRPGYGDAHNHLGVVLFSQARVEEAIAQYRQALEINPDDADVRDNLGKALLRKGDYDGAMACFQKSATLSSEPPATWYRLGNGFLQKGDLDAAIECYRQERKINPRSADTCANLGLAFFQKGEIKEAMDSWQKALEIKPDQLNALNNLAWLLATTPEASLRNGSKAVALAAQANQLSGGGDPTILHSLAAAYAEEGSYGLATVTARRALELAVEQKNDALAGGLQKEIKLYEAGTPVRESTMEGREMARPREAPQRGEPTAQDAPQ
jgi:tetratricopeptide (TPR) repeat protein